MVSGNAGQQTDQMARTVPRVFSNVGVRSHRQVLLRIKIPLLRGTEKSKLSTSGTLLYLLFVKHHKVSFQGREGMIYICKAFADLFQTNFAHPDDLCSTFRDLLN